MVSRHCCRIDCELCRTDACHKAPSHQHCLTGLDRNRCSRLDHCGRSPVPRPYERDHMVLRRPAHCFHHRNQGFIGKLKEGHHVHSGTHRLVCLFWFQCLIQCQPIDTERIFEHLWMFLIKN